MCMVCADWILYAERRSSSCADQSDCLFSCTARRGAQRCRCTRTFSTLPGVYYVVVERAEGHEKVFGTHRCRLTAVSRPRHLTWLRWPLSAHRRSCRARSLSAASIHSGLLIQHRVSVSNVMFQKCARVKGRVRQSKVSITIDCIEAIVRCHSYRIYERGAHL